MLSFALGLNTLYVPHHFVAVFAIPGNAELEPPRNISVAAIVRGLFSADQLVV